MKHKSEHSTAAKHYECLGRRLQKRAKTMAVEATGGLEGRPPRPPGRRAKQWDKIWGGCWLRAAELSAAFSKHHYQMESEPAVIAATLRDGGGQHGGPPCIAPARPVGRSFPGCLLSTSIWQR